MKQVICQNTQFFDSLSLHAPASIVELFPRGNQYTMLKEYVVATTNRTVPVHRILDPTAGIRERGVGTIRIGGGKHNYSDLNRTDRRNETDHLSGRAVENQTRENNAKQTRFTFSPSQLLSII